MITPFEQKSIRKAVQGGLGGSSLEPLHQEAVLGAEKAVSTISWGVKFLWLRYSSISSRFSDF